MLRRGVPGESPVDKLVLAWVVGKRILNYARQLVSQLKVATEGQKGSRKKWKPVTPAMAAGLADHVWTIDALRNFRVPLKHLWL